MEPPPSSDEPLFETYHRGPRARVEIASGAVAAAGLAWACLRFRPSRLNIEGASMFPALAPGDWALAVTPRRYARGDVVVVEHPERPGYEMVKRLVGMPGDMVDKRTLGPDEWWVLGDHAASSTDSRHFGPVGRAAIKATVVLVYWPKDRRRRVR